MVLYPSPFTSNLMVNVQVDVKRTIQLLARMVLNQHEIVDHFNPVFFSL